jgi:L-asparaginase
MKKVYVICTGGTISMQEVSDDSAQKTFVFEDEIRKSLPKTLTFPEVTFNVYYPQIDSSEMTINHWNKIGLDILNNYEKYDGFIILHGTDTMAYTGSALSFMFENLNKPIILTGAQTPLSYIVNDARENLINAIYIAGNFPINEVCIYFNQNLFRANRTTKLSTINYDAFASPNFPNLGEVGSTIKINTHKLLPPPSVENISLTKLTNADIRFIYMMPNMEAEVFKKLIDGAQAVIMSTYGDGNIRVLDNSFIKVINEAYEKGTIFINKSQCLNSKTSAIYTGGKALEKAGVISAADQTTETLMSKLLYFYSLNFANEKIVKLMQMNLRGELTKSNTYLLRYSLYKPANQITDQKNIKENQCLGFIKSAL